MSNGIPLTDEDREPWLQRVLEVSTQTAQSSNRQLAIVSCSMLKHKYRDLLKLTSPQTTFVFVFIYTSYEELVQRVANRKNHYMKNDMVKSQYDIMEIPDETEGIAINVNGLNPDQVLEKVVESVQNWTKV